MNIPLTLYPVGDQHGSVTLLRHMGDDLAVVQAARVSFARDVIMQRLMQRKDAKLIRFLISHRHGSPFEHTALTFRMVVPKFVRTHFLKHRAGTSVNENSGRYVKVHDRVYTPARFRQQAPTNRQASIEADGSLDQDAAREIWGKAWTGSYALYEQLLALGVTREQARGVLPEAQYTEFYWTCNLRSLMHLIDLRDHEDAQWETRQYAKALLDLARPVFPETFAAFEEQRQQQREMVEAHAEVQALRIQVEELRRQLERAA